MTSGVGWKCICSLCLRLDLQTYHSSNKNSYLLNKRFPILQVLYSENMKSTQLNYLNLGGISSDARKTIRVNISSTFIIFHSHRKHFNFISFKSLIEQSSYILITFQIFNLHTKNIFLFFDLCITFYMRIDGDRYYGLKF